MSRRLSIFIIAVVILATIILIVECQGGDANGNIPGGILEVRDGIDRESRIYSTRIMQECVDDARKLIGVRGGMDYSTLAMYAIPLFEYRTRANVVLSDN